MRTKYLVLVLALVGFLILPVASHAQSNQWANMLRAGIVSSISGQNFDLQLKDGSHINVDTSSAALLKRFGQRLQPSDIQQGDQIRVRGELDQMHSSMSATSLRNMSVALRNRSLRGKVLTVGTDSFTIQIGSQSQAIALTLTTKIFKGNKVGQVSDLMVGAMVNVSGTQDRTNGTITAKVIIIQLKNVLINGTISAINGNQQTITSQKGDTYNVDVTKTMILARGGRKMDAGKLNVNDKVMAYGQMVIGTTTTTLVYLRDMSVTLNTNTPTNHRPEPSNSPDNSQ